MMITISVILLCIFLSLVSGFKNVFVVVVDESTYLSALPGKGELTDYHYDGKSLSIVQTAESKKMRWKIFTDTPSICKLDSRITDKYSFLVGPCDISGKSGCAHLDSDSLFNSNFVDHEFPELSLYFPKNSGDSNWLRKFLYPIFSSPQYLSQTLTILVTKKTNGIASALLLGTDAQKPGRGQPYDLSKVYSQLKEYGFNLQPSSTPKSSGPWFDRIFYVIMENQPISRVMKYSQMRNIASQGTLLTQLYALVNPSQPNYLALASGSMMGVTDDDIHNLEGRCIVDLMEEKGVSWKAYMENFPGDCYSGAVYNRLYTRKHNPFMSFNNVRNNNTLCQKIVNADQLHVDVQNNDLPRYTFYTPNMDNDGHDTGLEFSSKWLESFLAPLLKNQNFMERTLVVVTYDEGIRPDNRIYTVLLGDMVPYGSLDDTNYTTYSLLRAAEDGLGLGTLTNNDLNAPLIDPINFYSGPLPPYQNKKFVYIGVGAGVFVSLSVMGATFYYVRVVRPKSKNGKAVAQNGNIAFLPLEGSKSFLKDSGGIISV